MNTRINEIPARDILLHYQKLGRFRKLHPAVGAGMQTDISQNPYVVSRSYHSGDYKDAVVIGLDMNTGLKEIQIDTLFYEGDELFEYYSGQYIMVKEGKVSIDSPYSLVMLGCK